MKRTVLITGGTKGIGKSMAEVLVKGEYNVVLNYHQDILSADQIQQQMSEAGFQIKVIKADVANKAEVENMVEEVISTFGFIDVLINNAGINIDKPILELLENEWDNVVDTNMKGTFFVSRSVAKRMLKQQGNSHIINISSTTAIKGRKNGINYCASKAGVIAMTKCMALEFAPKIRVNCIIPGFTWTEETAKRFDLENRFQQELASRNIPLARMASPVDIANCVAFLISENANYINGQKIIIDGGEFMF